MMKDMTYNIKLLILLIFIVFNISSCRRISPDARPLHLTSTRINLLDIAFAIQIDDDTINSVNFPLSQSFYIYEVINDSALDRENYVDGWGNYFKGKVVSNKLFIWSFGKNRRDDNMKGDDIFREISLD